MSKYYAFIFIIKNTQECKAAQWRAYNKKLKSKRSIWWSYVSTVSQSLIKAVYTKFWTKQAIAKRVNEYSKRGGFPYRAERSCKLSAILRTFHVVQINAVQGYIVHKYVLLSET